MGDAKRSIRCTLDVVPRGSVRSDGARRSHAAIHDGCRNDSRRNSGTSRRLQCPLSSHSWRVSSGARHQNALCERSAGCGFSGRRHTNAGGALKFCEAERRMSADQGTFSTIAVSEAVDRNRVEIFHTVKISGRTSLSAAEAFRCVFGIRIPRAGDTVLRPRQMKPKPWFAKLVRRAP